VLCLQLEIDSRRIGLDDTLLSPCIDYVMVRDEETRRDDPPAAVRKPRYVAVEELGFAARMSVDEQFHDGSGSGYAIA
jgi:hypothetical protein